MTGSLPDMNLSLDFMDLVGKLERQANIASRAGQYDELHGLAREFIEWQKRLRRAFVLALGETDTAVGWGTIVNQVAVVRHERDGAQTLQRVTVEESRRWEQAFGETRQELERLRRGSHDATP